MKAILYALLPVLLMSVGTWIPWRREPIDPAVASYLETTAKQFDQISEDRKRALERIAQYVQERLASGKEAKLTFICTHNSRRSHLAQVWAQAAACYYGVPEVRTYSGGTEATACNPRTVAALERAGFQIKRSSESENPVYEITYSSAQEPIRAFSKLYHDPPNPSSDFCAVMTCDSADKNCPIVRGGSFRVSIPYADPKNSDGTPQETVTYDERCRQICREMLYLFSRVTPEG